MSRSGIRLATLLLLSCAAGRTGATDPPSASLNPITGGIEIADSSQSGGHYRVRYAVEPSGGGTIGPVSLTDPTSDDLGPRIQVDADGNTWVVWWRDAATPEVRFLTRDRVTGSWSSEQRISDTGEHARHPEIALDGSTIWVAYEVQSGATFTIKVSATDDGAEPFPTATVLATTSLADPHPLVQTLYGHLWVSWVDSSTQLAWSEYDHDAKAWGEQQSVSYSGSSVELARKTLSESFY